MARKCPNCGTDTVMFSAVPLTREDQVGAACPKCDWRESMADLRRQLADAQAATVRIGDDRARLEDENRTLQRQLKAAEADCAAEQEMRRQAQAARETAAAACAAMRQWIDGLQASAPDSLAQYLLAGHPDPPQDGQALLDEHRRYGDALREIRNRCRCTCGEAGNTYCPRCDAVAALGEKESEHSAIRHTH